MVQAARSFPFHYQSLSLALLTLGACTDEFGECDQEAAEEVVYGRGGVVATKGQALMHDSCGQGTFCHSAAAKSENRRGVPFDLNFDMLPSPKSVGRVVGMRDAIWKTIENGQMPPSGYAVGDGDWLFDLERRSEADHLPALSTREGKAILRNWLACGAPTVTETKVPGWAEPKTVRCLQSLAGLGPVRQAPGGGQSGAVVVLSAPHHAGTARQLRVPYADATGRTAAQLPGCADSTERAIAGWRSPRTVRRCHLVVTWLPPSFSVNTAIVARSAPARQVHDLDHALGVELNGTSTTSTSGVTFMTGWMRVLLLRDSERTLTSTAPARGVGPGRAGGGPQHSSSRAWC